jgi:hypothetical protein
MRGAGGTVKAITLRRPMPDSVIVLLPKAAQLYRDEIEHGLKAGDDVEAVERARAWRCGTS